MYKSIYRDISLNSMINKKLKLCIQNTSSSHTYPLPHITLIIIFFYIQHKRLYCEHNATFLFEDKLASIIWKSVHGFTTIVHNKKELSDYLRKLIFLVLAEWVGCKPTSQGRNLDSQKCRFDTQK